MKCARLAKTRSAVTTRRIPLSVGVDSIPAPVLKPYSLLDAIITQEFFDAMRNDVWYTPR